MGLPYFGISDGSKNIAGLEITGNEGVLKPCSASRAGAGSFLQEEEQEPDAIRGLISTFILHLELFCLLLTTGLGNKM